MVDIKHRNNTIADFIFQLRKEKNLTYANLEELTGLRRGVLHKIQTGETKHPEFKTVKAIAPVLLVPYKKVIECYIEHENRVDTLLEILTEVITCEETVDLAPKVALRLLESPNNETEDSLERLFNFTQEMKGASLKVALFDVIIQYSRWHGTIPYLAKGLFRKYLIIRLDLKRLEQTYQEGQEILHYTDFLSREEKITFYFRMGLHAHNTKKYTDCIKHCITGINLEDRETELKARAYLAMINSHSQLKQYDTVERCLDVFERFEYAFVSEAAKITRAITKARKKEYDIAIPLLRSYMNELSNNYKISIATELIEIYLKTKDMKSIAELLEKEREFLPDNHESPHTNYGIGVYYRQKGAYQLEIGMVYEGIQSFVLSMHAFGKINETKEREECMNQIFTYFLKSNKQFDLQYVSILQEVYNI
ncbi:helix-turn-helix transcriptional regulator [Paenibacillus sp. MZ04-78.2]|uniref:helix-turn-helix domain-containing protein n=1 Tax=Paenibacillus sp. MZ04-78.2 TaxID=2962034 RepID=UPI0020B6F335|nr:helix-turn-helix transcriptional regulator [Paenibacillus sp. MZ04-78.2]MCP3775930.1 helix-turn-helix transcriptional regulator [Paenibacillus sp. MZ04-78.2]